MKGFSISKCDMAAITTVAKITSETVRTAEDGAVVFMKIDNRNMPQFQFGSKRKGWVR